MTMAMKRKTSLVNKHLRHAKFFANIPLRSHFTRLVTSEFHLLPN